MKPTYSNICIYILLKYIVFFLALMVIKNNYKLLQINNIRSFEDLLYYLIIVLFFPVIGVVLFSFPIFFSFKSKKTIYFLIKIIMIFSVEYFISIYFTSQKIYDRNILLMTIFGFLFLLLFFYKDVILKFTKKENK
jgi:hypothetical protein